MRVQLEVLRTQDGVLVGTADWAEGSANARFHGTLELLRVLIMAAGEQSGPNVEGGSEMSSPRPGDHEHPAPAGRGFGQMTPLMEEEGR